MKGQKQEEIELIRENKASFGEGGGGNNRIFVSLLSFFSANVLEMHKEASFRPWPMRSETKIGTYDSPEKKSPRGNSCFLGNCTHFSTLAKDTAKTLLPSSSFFCCAKSIAKETFFCFFF